MKFRTKYIKVIQKKVLREKNLLWGARQLIKALQIPLLVNTRRPFVSPILCGLVVTYRCNMKCGFCSLSERANLKKELSEAEFKTVIDDFFRLGATGIGFTGGEPLLRKDIFNLIVHAKNKKLATQLTTNGMLLDREVSNRLVDAGLDDLGVSLESSIPDLHDQIRGVKGSWQIMIKGIENFIQVRKKTRKDVVITVSTVINKKNLGNMKEFINFCVNLGVDAISFGLVQKEFSKEDLSIDDYEGYQDVIEFIKNYAKNGKIIDNSFDYLNEMSGGFNAANPCWAGYHSLYVDCYGKIFPCFYYMERDLPVENIRVISVSQLWKSPQYNLIRKKLLNCQKCFFLCQMELNSLFNKFNIFTKKHLDHETY